MFFSGTILRDDGVLQDIKLGPTSSTNTIPNLPAGWVISGHIYQTSAGRISAHVRVIIWSSAAIGRHILIEGIATGSGLGLGDVKHGESFTYWETVFHDRAGNAAALDWPLYISGRIRKILAITWYYHSDGNAGSRTFQGPQLLGLGGAKPTGFTLTDTNALLWSSPADITLTVNEEGAFVVQASDGENGISVRVDNGAIARDDMSTNPTPFPLLVTGEDTDTIFRFRAITGGLVGDKHSAYILVQESRES